LTQFWNTAEAANSGCND